MYHIVIPCAALPVATLIEALHAFHHDERFGSIDSADIQLWHDGAPIKVLRYNGELAIRLDMPPATLIAAMLDEARDRWFSRDGAPLKPYEVRRAHWEMLFWFFRIVRKEALLASVGVLEREKFDARSRGETFNLEDICRRFAEQSFGFGFCGPLAEGRRGADSRHEVHVAYALLGNLSVPDGVLADYRAPEGGFRGMEWASVLIDVPALRGVVSDAKLRWLVPVMQRDGKAITADNAAMLAAHMQALPDEPTYEDVDDLLFARGVLDKLPIPESYQQPVDVGRPVSPLAARLRELQADGMRAKQLAWLEGERSAGRVSRRRYELSRTLADLDRGRFTYERANEIASAVERRDIAFLLSLLDTPDDRNRWSKQAIHEELGVKIRGLKPEVRRRAIFQLCEHDEAAQAAYEAEAQVAKAHRGQRRKFEDACEQASRARYRRDDNTIVSGTEHVEQSIAAGYTEIRAYPKGAAKVYVLVSPTSTVAKRLSARDGTLAYARAMLDQRAA